MSDWVRMFASQHRYVSSFLKGVLSLLYWSSIGGAMKRVTFKIAVLAILAAGTGARAQQPDARQILAGAIYQLQTGTPNPTWYGQQLWQLIAYQTGNTGVYPQLAQLGPVQNITVTGQIQLPAGIVFAMTAQHVGGMSYWEFGIGSLTNRIEYAAFVTGPGTTPSETPPPQTGKEGPDRTALVVEPDRPQAAEQDPAADRVLPAAEAAQVAGPGRVIPAADPDRRRLRPARSFRTFAAKAEASEPCAHDERPFGPDCSQPRRGRCADRRRSKRNRCGVEVMVAC